MCSLRTDSPSKIKSVPLFVKTNDTVNSHSKSDMLQNVSEDKIFWMNLEVRITTTKKQQQQPVYTLPIS